jgi:DnaJ-class molecular chaperone
MEKLIKNESPTSTWKECPVCLGAGYHKNWVPCCRCDGDGEIGSTEHKSQIMRAFMDYSEKQKQQVIREFVEEGFKQLLTVRPDTK